MTNQLHGTGSGLVKRAEHDAHTTQYEHVSGQKELAVFTVVSKCSFMTERSVQGKVLLSSVSQLIYVDYRLVLIVCYLLQ